MSESTIETTTFNPQEGNKPKDPNTNENTKKNFWNVIKERLPFWKKQASGNPDIVIQGISKINDGKPEDVLNPKDKAGELMEQAVKEPETEEKKLETEFLEYTDKCFKERKLTEELLDLFEKYIDTTTKPDDFSLYGKTILDKSLFMQTMYQDKTLSTDVETIDPSTYSPDNISVKDLPAHLRENLLSYFSRSHNDYIEIPKDPRIIRAWNLVDKYYNKQFDLLIEAGLVHDQNTVDKFISSHEGIFHNFSGMSDKLYQRRCEGNVITSDTFLGHGTSYENFLLILKSGNLKSPMNAMNESPSLLVRDFAVDAGGIFFYSDLNRSEHMGVYMNPHRGNALYNGANIGIIFRTEDILKRGYTIGSKFGVGVNAEFFATATPQAFEENKLSEIERRKLIEKDVTELPIKDAYILFAYIENNLQIEIENLLKEKYGGAWFKEHVVSWNPKTLRDELRKKIKADKNNSVEHFYPVKGWGNEYFIWKKKE